MYVETMLALASKRLTTLADSAPLLKAAELLVPGVDLVVVCNAGALLVGVVTKSDVVGQISRCQGASCTCALATVMTRDVLMCHAHDDLGQLWAQMKSRGIKNVPLVDQDQRPIGIVTARDALQVLLKETESEELMLRDYVMGFGYR